MKLALYDKGGGDFYSAALPAGQEIVGKDAVSALDPGQFGVDELRQFSHVVCHLNGNADAPSWPSLLAVEDLSQVKAIIRVSSRGAGGMSDSFKKPYRITSTGPWIFHLVEPSGSLTVEGWKRVFSAFEDWDPAGDSLSTGLSEIFDPNPEARLSLRLLCEAWQYVGKAESKVAITNKDGTAALTVHSPGCDPEKWFKAFGGSDVAPQEIAKSMGNAQREAQDLLEACRNGAGPTNQLVEAFLDKAQH